jgi:ribosomal protein S18 acetylase RimI-like enzyme
LSPRVLALIGASRGWRGGDSLASNPAPYTISLDSMPTTTVVTRSSVTTYPVELFVHIREATRADVPRVVALLADDNLGRRRESVEVPLDERYWAAFDAIDADPRHQLVVLEADDGQVAGCLQLSLLPYLTFRGGWRAQIEAVRVAYDRRGTGLGRQLFEWAIEEARRRECHLVQLTTNVQRPDALAFYESLGLEVTHQGLKLYLQGDVTGR